MYLYLSLCWGHTTWCPTASCIVSYCCIIIIPHWAKLFYSDHASISSTSIRNREGGIMCVALSLHSQREYICFIRIKILNIVLSTQSYKIYRQKLSVIVPDKWIKIIEILWHICKFNYIFL